MLGKKWSTVLTLSLAIGIAYILRTNISTSLILISDELLLNEKQQGLVISAFYMGYVAFMFVGGLIADRVGAYKTLFFSVLCLSITTMLTSLTNSIYSLFAMRFLVGVFQAPMFPACAKLVNQLYDKKESGRATAIFDSGAYVGAALAVPLVSIIMVALNWRFTFVLCGLLGVIWILYWRMKFFGVVDINEKRDSKYKPEKAVAFELCKNRKVIGACIGMFCYNYGKNFYLSWLPMYLVKDMGMEILKVGVVAMLPWIGAVVGNLSSGFLTDYLMKKGYSVTFSRKLPLCIGLLSSSVISTTLLTTNPVIVVMIVTFSFAMNIAASASIWAIPGDIAPRNEYVATIGGIQNTVANMAGIVAPVITGYLIYTLGSFKYALILSSVICIIGALSYLVILGKIERIHIEEGFNHEEVNTI